MTYHGQHHFHHLLSSWEVVDNLLDENISSTPPPARHNLAGTTTTTTTTNHRSLDRYLFFHSPRHGSLRGPTNRREDPAGPASVATPVPAAANLALFSRLPLELWRGVLRQVDLDSLARFRLTCRTAGTVIDALPEVDIVRRHAPNVLRGIEALDLGRWVTPADLFQRVRNRECFSCGRFGGYLFLPGLRRSCFHCLYSRQCQPLSPAWMWRRHEVNLSTLVGIPGGDAYMPWCVARPGRYGPRGVRQSKVMLVDPTGASRTARMLRRRVPRALSTTHQEWTGSQAARHEDVDLVEHSVRNRDNTSSQAGNPGGNDNNNEATGQKAVPPLPSPPPAAASEQSSGGEDDDDDDDDASEWDGLSVRSASPASFEPNRVTNFATTVRIPWVRGPDDVEWGWYCACARCVPDSTTPGTGVRTAGLDHDSRLRTKEEMEEHHRLLRETGRGLDEEGGEGDVQSEMAHPSS